MTIPGPAKILSAKIKNHSATIGVIGLGYVGLPLVIRFGEENFNVIGFDIDEDEVKTLNRGKSYIKHIQSERIARLIKKNKFKATSDYSMLKSADCIINGCSNYHYQSFFIRL